MSFSKSPKPEFMPGGRRKSISGPRLAEPGPNLVVDLSGLGELEVAHEAAGGRLDDFLPAGRFVAAPEGDRQNERRAAAAKVSAWDSGPGEGPAAAERDLAFRDAEGRGADALDGGPDRFKQGPGLGAAGEEFVDGQRHIRGRAEVYAVRLGDVNSLLA